MDIVLGNLFDFLCKFIFIFCLLILLELNVLENMKIEDRRRMYKVVESNFLVIIFFKDMGFLVREFLCLVLLYNDYILCIG